MTALRLARLDDVALLVQLGVEGGRAAAAGACGLAPGDLVGALGADELDPPFSQGLAGRGMGVRLVREYRARPGPGAAGAGAGDADAVEQGQELRVAAVLAGSHDDSHRQAAAVDREVGLGAQPAPGPAEPLALHGEGLDGGAAAPFFRAPAACWCARMTVESTLMTHSTAPAESSFTMTSSRIRCHVPSAVRSRSRSCAVFHGP